MLKSSVFARVQFITVKRLAFSITESCSVLLKDYSQGNYSAIHTGVDECSTATYGGSCVPPADETEQNWSAIAVEPLHIGAEK